MIQSHVNDQGSNTTDEELLSRYLSRPSYPEPVYIDSSSILTMPRTSSSTNLKIQPPAEVLSPELALSKLPLLYHDWDPKLSGDRGVNSGVIDFTGFPGKHEDSTTIIYQRPPQGWMKSLSVDPKLTLYKPKSPETIPQTESTSQDVANR